MQIRNQIMEIIFEETGGLPYKQVEALQKRLDVFFKRKRQEGITANNIIDIVCNELDVTKEEVMSKERHAKKVNARHIATSMLQKHLNLSTTEIGALLGRDHSTIIHSLRKVEDYAYTDHQYQRILDIINERIATSWLH